MNKLNTALTLGSWLLFEAGGLCTPSAPPVYPYFSNREGFNSYCYISMSKQEEPIEKEYDTMKYFQYGMSFGTANASGTSIILTKALGTLVIPY